MIDLLAPGGAFEATADHYEDRPQQRRMARAVATALELDRALIVEAGTGTGKTLAYLLPALLSGKRVIISTGTRTLQEQLADRDVELLRQIVGRPFEVVVLKGVSNYLCQRRFHDRWTQQLRLPMVDRADDAAQAVLERIATWAKDTPTGDRAELTDIADNHPLWREVTVDADERLGPRCPHFDRCFVAAARRRAARADLIIVNHHLYFADLALRDAAPGARVLPDYDAVIFDEAHQLEEIITSHFGIQVSTGRFKRLARAAKTLLERREQDHGRRTGALFDRLDASQTEFFTRVRAGLPALVDGERVELPAELFREAQRTQAWFDLDNALDDLGQHLVFFAEVAGDKDTADEAHAVARQISRDRDALARFCEQELSDTETFVYWASAERTGVQLRGAPAEIDHVLQRQLGRGAPLVFTSATMSISGRLDHMRERLGLDELRVDELVVPSPFDYASQAMLYIARDLPDPREPSFGPQSWQRIEELLAITEGRAFVLFTSHRALRAAAQRLQRLDYPLFVQGRQPRAALLEQFRRTERAVLLGTGSFWDGVDVPGDALSLVIIDKLPFGVPTDPLTAARMRKIEERGGGAFRDYLLPQAALALKQGFGRLIRRRDVRGIVAVLDNRMVTKTYGRVFVDTLPAGVRRTCALQLVRRFWGARAAA